MNGGDNTPALGLRPLTDMMDACRLAHAALGSAIGELPTEFTASQARVARCLAESMSKARQQSENLVALATLISTSRTGPVEVVAMQFAVMQLGEVMRDALDAHRALGLTLNDEAARQAHAAAVAVDAAIDCIAGVSGQES